MEPFSIALLISGLLTAMYQMSGTPFILNIIIFCFCLLLSFYAMFMSGYLIPCDGLFYWIYSCNKNESSDEEEIELFEHDDQITKKLRELTGHIVRDFILSWYNKVTDEVTFVQEAFELFEHLLRGARSRVASTDKNILLANILEEFLKHYIIYKKAAKDIGSRAYSRNDEDEEKQRELLTAVSYIGKNGHSALENLPDSEMEHLRGIIILILKGLLPEDYELTGTPLYLVRELIAQNVLNSLVNLLSDPLWIYNTLVKILDETEIDSPTENSETANRHSENEGNSINGVENNSSIGNTMNSSAVLIANSESLFNDGSLSPTVTVVNSENCLSTSRASTTSMASQLSADSDDLQPVSPRQEDVPLPLMSSEMHFAPEWNNIDRDAASLNKHILSVANGRTPQEKLFFRIRIPEAVEMKENFDGGRKYTLYKITYKTREFPQAQTVAIDIPLNNEESANNNNIESNTRPKKISHMKKHQVQRRFREFHVLQERLSQNMVARNLIANINGPSRMFPVPFGNMDKEYIEKRRKFLQAYLREICSIPFISHCEEIREFLAFEMDPRIAYVQKPEPIPRFDKMLKTALKDLLGSTSMKFSDTLTSTDNESAFKIEGPSIREKRESESNGSIFPNNEVENVGAVTKLRNKVFGSSKHFNNQDVVADSAKRQFANFENRRNVFPLKWKHENDINSTPLISIEGSEQTVEIRGTGDGCDAGSIPISETDSDISSARLVLQFLLHTWNVKPGTHGIIAVTLTKYVSAFLVKEINELTTKDSWTKYLTTLHNALWPEGEWNSNDDERITWMTASSEIKADAFRSAKKTLEKALPDVIRFIVDEETYSNGVEHLLLSLQNPLINRHLLYKMLDLIIQQLFSDFDDVVHRNNISLNVVTSPAS
uniref:sorting nexin-19-like n=1 Tax=Styela clava TaxID=7725 RepID=UPI00193A6DB9|nr:sorting nexin-19-like [Styela clava]